MQSFLRVSAALVCLTAVAHGADWKALKPQGYVSDFSHVVDPQSRAEIESYAASVEHSTGVQLAFVTIPTLDGEPIEDVANDIFHAWGVGKKGEDNGAMLLLVTGDHKSRLEVGPGLGGAIPDGMAGLLLDSMRPALRQNRYGPAMLMAAVQLGQTIAQSKGITIQQPRIEQPVPRGTSDSIPWPLILFGIFFLLLILRRGGGTRGGPYTGGSGGGFWSGLLLGSLLNSGRRGGYYGGGGGGFGGYDSGGSGGGFGGFGGGDSGGGGASSDW